VASEKMKRYYFIGKLTDPGKQPHRAIRILSDDPYAFYIDDALERHKQARHSKK